MTDNLLVAFARGYYDAREHGVRILLESYSDEERSMYNRGYDRGLFDWSVLFGGEDV